MRDRERILARLKGRFDPPAKREKPTFQPIRYEDPLETFRRMVEAAGGRTQRASAPIIDEKLAAMKASTTRCIDTRRLTAPISENFDIETLTRCEVAIVEGSFGVAENGAVWIDPQARYPRALLTLAENLVIVLDASQIVATMHEAYDRIDLSSVDYALFMAGPSKTADIEQSLVIGAHGAMGLEVWLKE